MYLILYQSYHPSILLGPMHQKAFIQICFKSIQSSNNNLLIRTKSCRIIRKFIRRIDPMFFQQDIKKKNGVRTEEKI